MVRRGRNAAGGFFQDFKDFALKGNVLDLAVAVIIGAAFGKIVSSFVEDVIMPALINPVLAQAGTDWRELTIGPVLIGQFLGTVVDFVIIALIIFLVVRAIEKARRKEEIIEEATPDPQIIAQERLTLAVERLTQVMESRE
ncbi:large conductance mechanosensitive channel protein MscL [Lusitaniella coriacea]|uniref:large conductance mechanosensitive channel protein MscL n=1 Tax=Lusitaniella coriacea TaxID=1983105 RepID=UPI003CE88997